MKPKNVWTILIILPLLMAACLPQEVKDLTATVLVSPTVEETDPNAISTSVAQTVEAELTQVALSNPTNTPLPSATDVPEPTETPTQPPETPTNTPLPSPTIEAAFDNQAQFVADVTIPDGTPIVAGHTFTKTWRLRNVGTTTWTTDYSFVFINGDRMEGQAVNLSFDVSPGGEIDISIPMIAPDDAGTYVGYWMFKAPDTDEEEGAVFGLGTDARQAIYVEIEVIPATPTPTPTSTPADEEETPTPEPIGVNNISLVVDTNSYIGACPVTLDFTVGLTLNGPVIFDYQVDAIPDDPGFTFTDVPAASITSNQTGIHTLTVSFALTIDTSVSGQIIFHVTTPNDITSPPVAFAVTCQ